MAGLYFICDKGTGPFASFWKAGGAGRTIDLRSAGIFDKTDVARLADNKDLLFVPTDQISSEKHAMLVIENVTMVEKSIEPGGGTMTIEFDQTLSLYIKFLKSEVEFREIDLKVLGEQIKTSRPQLDPNWRLEQGKLHAIVSILKDLCEIGQEELPEDFYPNTLGLLEESDADLVGTGPLEG